MNYVFSICQWKHAYETKISLVYSMFTLGEWEITVVCRQFIAARATSLLPFRMLFFTKRSKDSHSVVREACDIIMNNQCKAVKDELNNIEYDRYTQK